MKALFWVFVAIGCVYVFYTGSKAVWSYLEITSLVEEVVNERASRTERQERAGRVRDDIAKKVAASGINVNPHPRPWGPRCPSARRAAASTARPFPSTPASAPP